ncbi:MAG: response regulator transcription factor [Oscillospiraceae bacterium]|nr:response regulator transcription factor [Oscillospiraceae bacterium]
MNKPESNGRRILLVEDNKKIMRGNKRMFEWEGYAIDAAATLGEAHAAIDESRPDAIVLDIMLPDGSGLEFMRELRGGSKSGIPVLLLTGLAGQEDVVRGLTLGGDDYLTKPYDFPVLLARVEALLRRSAQVPEKIAKGRLTLDVTAGAAALDGRDLLLTQKEFALLLCFVQNEERFLSPEYLYEKVWKAPMTGDSGAVRKTVSTMRGKIRGSGWTVDWSKGEGYCFERE